MFQSEKYLKLALVENAQADSRPKGVSDMRMWRWHKQNSIGRAFQHELVAKSTSKIRLKVVVSMSMWR